MKRLQRLQRWLGLGLAILMAGCATTGSQQKFIVDGVGGDLWIRDIGSDAQELRGSNSLEINTEIPIKSEKIPVGLNYQNAGLFRGMSAEIKNVSGSVFIDKALTGAQGIDLPASIEKLFVPGNPFDVQSGGFKSKK